ncbi:MAG: UDP-2,3-diacylglucosamine diphosphatase [Magnetospirillum sp.]|nr:UDP-2,3-diacylglucosamine diphosphatase [Magnetospirillum sp.]
MYRGAGVGLNSRHEYRRVLDAEAAAVNADVKASRHYRSIWISDIHLGTRGCKAEALLDFLKHCESDFLYLVGDVVDGWRLKRSWYWPQAHNDVVQKLLRRARKGTCVIYVPGNHDEFVRDYLNLSFGDIEVCDEPIHLTADGRRLLILHGDAFDGVVKYAKWLAHLGDSAYTVALTLNNWLNMVRRRLGLTYWSLSAYLKHRVKNAVQYMANYEHAVAEEARRHGVDGVVCGHIHHAEMRDIDGILYCNDGDWVESCTALVEHADGRLEILDWLSLSGKEQQCAYSSYPTPGTPRSTGSSARSTP